MTYIASGDFTVEEVLFIYVFKKLLLLFLLFIFIALMDLNDLSFCYTSVTYNNYILLQ